jgi:adenylate cyclase class 2
MLEQEIKLAFADVIDARAAVASTAARLVEPRRLIDDLLFDTSDGRIARTGASLRLRSDRDRVWLTAKGPVLPGPVKTREEFETPVGDAVTVEAMLRVLGFRPVFRSQKYREEYTLDAVRLSLDEAPFGVFLEVEGPERDIHRVSALLGRTPADYRRESYMALWRQHCLGRGVTQPLDMTFANVVDA